MQILRYYFCSRRNASYRPLDKTLQPDHSLDRILGQRYAVLGMDECRQQVARCNMTRFVVFVNLQRISGLLYMVKYFRVCSIDLTCS